MERNPFSGFELCGGGPCASKYDCARYMANVDVSKARNTYVILVAKPCFCCSAFLDRPNENYPDNGNDNDAADGL